MKSRARPRMFAVASLSFVLLAMLGAVWQYLGSARAADQTPTLKPLPTDSGARNLILGSQDGTQPQNMEQFLTAVTKDVDSYWTKVFQESGLSEPRVSYLWIPAGQTAASACGDENGTLGDSARSCTARASTASVARGRRSRSA